MSRAHTLAQSTEGDRRFGGVPAGLASLLLSRFLLALIGAGIILVQEGGIPQTATAMGAYILCIAISALNVLYLLAARRYGAASCFVFGQIIVDIFFISALVYITGGVSSNLRVFYFAAILSGSMLLSIRHSLFLASLATIILSAISGMYWLCAEGRLVMPFVDEVWLQRSADVPKSFLYAFLFAQGVAFHMVAFLSGALSDRLDRSRILSSEILRRTSDGVVVLDIAGRILFANSEFRRLVDLDPDTDLGGRTVSGVLRDPRYAALRALLAPDTAGKESRLEIVREGGDVMALNVRTSPLYHRRQQIVAFVADVTSAGRVRRAEARADHMEEIAAMAAGIAHEVGNPLACIRSCAQELGRLDMPDPEGRKLTDMICGEVDRLDRIITEFRQFARMRPPQLRPCNLAPLLEDVAALLERQRTRPEDRIELLLPGAVWCRGDAEHLRRAFLNIGLNALAAMEDRPGLLTIGALPLPDGASRGHAGIQVSFADNGKGIEEEELDRIFEPFHTTRDQGTGLGLSVVNRIIRAHRGRITVESAPGAGSTFRIWIPGGPGPPRG